MSSAVGRSANDKKYVKVTNSFLQCSALERACIADSIEVCLVYPKRTRPVIFGLKLSRSTRPARVASFAGAGSDCKSFISLSNQSPPLYSEPGGTERYSDTVASVNSGQVLLACTSHHADLLT